MEKEKTVYFLASDGIKLCGTLTVPDGVTDTCIILCHGITVSRNYEDVFPGLALSLAKKGSAVFRFDFRGHGDSAGKQTEFTISAQLKDIKAAVDWVKASGYKNLGLVAASFGAGASAIFGAKNPKTFRSLALLFPVIDYNSLLCLKTPWARKYFGPRAMINLERKGFAKIGSRGYKIGKELIAQMKAFKPWRELEKIKAPILFVHGDADTYVPLGDSLVYSKTLKNATMKVVGGGHHGLHNSPKIHNKTIDLVTDFMVKNLR